MIVLHRELKISKTCIHETHHLIILRDEASPYELSCALVSHLTQPYTYPLHRLSCSRALNYQGMRPAHHDWGAQRNGNYHGRSMEGKIKGAPNYFKKYQKIIGNCLIVDISIIQFEGGKASCLNKYKWRNCARLWFLAFPCFSCMDSEHNAWKKVEIFEGSVFGAVCVEVNILGFRTYLIISIWAWEGSKFDQSKVAVFLGSLKKYCDYPEVKAKIATFKSRWKK